jgi:hypothetical protein
MLTQYGIQAQLDMIANEVSQMPGLYYELYSRIYSDRVHQWMRSVSPAQAEMIQQIAEEDPDFLPDVELMVPPYARHTSSFNPAWDMEY